MKQLNLGVAVGVLLLFVSCSHESTKPDKGFKLGDETDYPSRLIDAHSHFSIEEDESESQPSIKMEQMYQNAKVVGAVVHLPQNRKKLARLKIKKDRKGLKLAICAAIVPGITVEVVEQGLKQSDYQCMKIYLGYIPKYANDPFYLGFYHLAEKYHVPVVFHTGDTYDKKAKIKYAEPLQIDEIAVQYPKVNFVLAHMGNPWVTTAAEVVYKNDNVFVDLSALMLGDVSKQNPEAVEELVIKPIRWFWLYVENPKKMMFGSDWPLMDVRPYVQAVMKAIPKEHWDDVFYKNAAELFKLEN